MSNLIEDDLLDRIIRLIEILGYIGIESLEPSWVRSVLVDNGPARQKFMEWIVSELCPSDSKDLSLVPQQAQSQKILQSLSGMGLCCAGDKDLIEATAPSPKQLKFWRSCLDKIGQLRQFAALSSRHQYKKSTNDDLLLDHLAHSPHLNHILRDTGANVIPGDLKEKYRANHKAIQNIPVPELLRDTEGLSLMMQEQYNAMNKDWKDISLVTGDEGSSENQQNLCKAVSALNKQQDLFQDVFTLYIQPWTGSSPQLELPATGPLVQQATSRLQDLSKAIKSMEEVSQSSEDLGELDKQMMKHTQNPATIMSTLQSIVTHEANAK